MNTPTITEFYRTMDPQKRRKLLEQSIQAGEDAEKNAIRLELLDLRYQVPKRGRGKEPVDTLMRLWMTMEFDNAASKSNFSKRSCQKELRKHMESIQFLQTMEKSELHRELLFEECCHMVELYMSISEKDKSYRNAFLGLMTMSDERVQAKLRKDIYETAVLLPQCLGLEKELEMITEAARKAYSAHFPDEDPLPEAPAKTDAK